MDLLAKFECRVCVSDRCIGHGKIGRLACERTERHDGTVGNHVLDLLSDANGHRSNGDERQARDDPSNRGGTTARRRRASSTLKLLLFDVTAAMVLGLRCCCYE